MSHLTEEQLNLYLDDELSTVERAAVEAHLAGCDACRTELASLRALFTALDALQPAALAADLTPVVLRGVAAERRRTVRRRRISCDALCRASPTHPGGGPVRTLD
jgi:anti-sigma factor RsiW